VFIDKIDNAPIRSQTVSNIVSAFADSNRIKSALSYITKIKNPDDLSRANAALAKYEARNKNFQKAASYADLCFPKDRLEAYTHILNKYSIKINPKFKDTALSKEKVNIAEH
jgi:hypothetical protein